MGVWNVGIVERTNQPLWPILPHLLICRRFASSSIMSKFKDRACQFVKEQRSSLCTSWILGSARLLNWLTVTPAPSAIGLIITRSITAYKTSREAVGLEWLQRRPILWSLLPPSRHQSRLLASSGLGWALRLLHVQYVVGSMRLVSLGVWLELSFHLTTLTSPNVWSSLTSMKDGLEASGGVWCLVMRPTSVLGSMDRFGCNVHRTQPT